MRAVVGDVIGTTDGRYGEVIDVDGKDITFIIAVGPDEPCPVEATHGYITQAEVASIV